MTSLQKLLLIIGWLALILAVWEFTQTLLGTTVFVVGGLTLLRWVWNRLLAPSPEKVNEIAS